MEGHDILLCSIKPLFGDVIQCSDDKSIGDQIARLHVQMVKFDHPCVCQIRRRWRNNRRIVLRSKRSSLDNLKWLRDVLQPRSDCWKFRLSPWPGLKLRSLFFLPKSAASSLLGFSGGNLTRYLPVAGGLLTPIALKYESGILTPSILGPIACTSSVSALVSGTTPMLLLLLIA